MFRFFAMVVLAATCVLHERALASESSIEHRVDGFSIEVPKGWYVLTRPSDAGQALEVGSFLREFYAHGILVPAEHTAIGVRSIDPAVDVESMLQRFSRGYDYVVRSRPIIGGILTERQEYDGPDDRYAIILIRKNSRLFLVWVTHGGTGPFPGRVEQAIEKIVRSLSIKPGPKGEETQ